MKGAANAGGTSGIADARRLCARTREVLAR